MNELRYVKELKRGFRIPMVAEGEFSKPYGWGLYCGSTAPKSNQLTKEDWDYVFKLMHTMPILDIAARSEVNISASRMYDMRRKHNLPRIPAVKRCVTTEQRAARGLDIAKLFRTWGK